MMNRTSIRNAFALGLAVSLSLTFYGCGAVANTSPSTTEAEKSDIVVTGTQAGVTPFISSIQLTGQSGVSADFRGVYNLGSAIDGVSAGEC